MIGRFFSFDELRERIGPDVDDRRLEDRLEDLREWGVVVTETYGSVTVYGLAHPSPNPDAEAAPNPDTEAAPNPDAEAAPNPLDRLSVRGFLAFRDPDGIRTLVLAGYQLSLVLATLGVVLAALGADGPISSDHELWAAAGNLFVVCLGIQLLERLRRPSRSGG